MSAAEQPRRSVTLAEIAREAGTSASIASRALSGRGYDPRLVVRGSTGAVTNP